jgi:hypothetical protein
VTGLTILHHISKQSINLFAQTVKTSGASRANHKQSFKKPQKWSLYLLEVSLLEAFANEFSPQINRSRRVSSYNSIKDSYRYFRIIL